MIKVPETCNICTKSTKVLFTILILLIFFQGKPLFGQEEDTTEVRKMMLEGIENMERENYRSAIELFDRGRQRLHSFAVELEEKNANIIESLELTRKAESLIDENNFEGALELLNEAIELDNNNIEAYKFRGSVRLVLEQQKSRRRDRNFIRLLNDYTNAIRIVERRVDLTPRGSQERKELEKEKAKILINRAYVKMQERRSSSIYSAIDDYSDAIRYDDQNWDGYLGRAVANNRVGEHRREVRDYLRAVDLIEEHDYSMTDEEWAELYYKIAMAYVNSRDNRNAFNYAEKSYNLGYEEAESLMDRTRP